MVLTVVAALFQAIPSWATLRCGEAVAGEGSNQNIARLMHFLDEGDVELLGAYRVQAPKKRPQYLILVSGSETDGVLVDSWGAGNEDPRLFASKTLVVDEHTVFWNKLRKLGNWVVGLGGLGVLIHELVNPGVLPNSLPMLPALALAWAGPKIASNLFAIKHRLSDMAPEDQTALEDELAAYAVSASPERKGLRAWLRRQFSFGKSPVIQIVDVTHFTVNRLIEGAPLDLAARIFERSPQTLVEQFADTREMRDQMIQDIGVTP